MENQIAQVAEQIERIVERLNVDAVFGEVRREGDVAIIPVVQVGTTFGFGYGSGESPSQVEERPADTAVRLRRGTRCRRQDDDGADTLPAIRSVGPIARCTAGQGKPAFLCRPFLLRSGCYRYLYYL